MATLSATSAVIARKLLDENNTVVSGVQIRTAINDAIKYWKRRAFWFNEFSETITLTIGNPAFSLVTNTPIFLFEKGGAVVVENMIRYPLTKITSEKYDLLNIQAPGRPFAWTYRNQGFELYSYPDQAYSMVCRGIKDYADFATEGADDGNTSDFLTHAELLIQYWALSRLHGEYRQDEKMESYYTARAKDEFENLKEFNADKDSTGTNEVHSFLI